MKPRYDTAISFTGNVRRWVVECFGVSAANDRTERVHRFLKEALELAQAAGCSKTEADQLLVYVYGRHVGDPAQEVGGVMTTLAALCAANGLDSEKCGRAELERCWVNIVKMRTKQAQKPKYGTPAWTKTPSAEPGWYWIRKDGEMFASNVDKLHSEYLVRTGYEFWPVRVEEPK